MVVCYCLWLCHVSDSALEGWGDDPCGYGLCVCKLGENWEIRKIGLFWGKSCLCVSVLFIFIFYMYLCFSYVYSDFLP
jgi:hypothetical protein